jgi:hypothetical protein
LREKFARVTRPRVIANSRFAPESLIACGIAHQALPEAEVRVNQIALRQILGVVTRALGVAPAPAPAGPAAGILVVQDSPPAAPGSPQSLAFLPLQQNFPLLPGPGIDAGSVWINASLLAANAPQNTIAGCRDQPRLWMACFTSLSMLF